MLAMQKIFATGHLMSACRRCNEKPNVEKLGHNSKLTSPLNTASTRKCRVNLQPHQVITQQTPMWAKMKNKWLNKPLEHWPTWPHPLNRTEG
jgi:hypothetical protein